MIAIRAVSPSIFLPTGKSKGWAGDNESSLARKTDDKKSNPLGKGTTRSQVPCDGGLAMQSIYKISPIMRHVPVAGEVEPSR